MKEFIFGMLTLGWSVAGLFFLRFWHRTRDSFFLCFAVSFWTLAASRVAMMLSRTETEDQAAIYWFRFAAFLLIAVAIIHQNRKHDRKGL